MGDFLGRHRNKLLIPLARGGVWETQNAQDRPGTIKWGREMAADGDFFSQTASDQDHGTRSTACQTLLHERHPLWPHIGPPCPGMI